MRVRVALIVALAKVASAVIGGIARLRSIGPILWPTPTGANSIGRRDLTLPCNPPLMVRVWYPAIDTADNRATLYSRRDIRGLVSGGSLLPRPIVEAMGDTLTAASEGAPLKWARKWPLVIFSHGLGGHVAQNTVLAECLASHGWIVASIAHPGGAASITWPEGGAELLSSAQRGRLMLNPVVIESMRRVRNSVSRDDLKRELLRHVSMPPLSQECERWASHISAAITAFERDEILSTGIDFERVAVVGMSFGGSASALAALRDDRIKAVANLDGGQFGADLFEREVPVPILILQSRAAKLVAGSAWNDFFYERPESNSPRPTVRFIAEDAGHLDFTDLTLVAQPLMRRLFGLHVRDGAKMAVELAEIVRVFLEDVLHGPNETRVTDREFFKPHVPPHFYEKG